MKRGKFLISLIICISLITNIFAISHENELRITYTDDKSAKLAGKFLAAKDGGVDAVEEVSWIEDSDVKEAPSINNFNSYLKKYEFLLHVGHGWEDGKSLYDNTKEAFKGETGYGNGHLYYSDLDSKLKSRVVTLFSCDVGKGKFGKTLLNNGIECVVGWSGDLTPDSANEAYLWTYNFYKCDDDPDYCEYYASYKSGVWGSEDYGDCDTKMTRNLRISSSQNDNSQYQLDNGFIKVDKSYFYRNLSKNILSVRKTINKDEAISIAKDFLDVPEGYKLLLVDEDDKSYTVVYERYLDNVRVTFDSYVASVDKNSGEVFMYKKTFTDNLEKFNVHDINQTKLMELNDFSLNNISQVENVLVKSNDNHNKLGWEIYFNSNGINESLTIDYNYNQI